MTDDDETPALRVHGDIGLVESLDVATRLPPRETDTHKRATGVVQITGLDV